MKKLLGILVLGLYNCNIVFADIGLNCFTTSLNERDRTTKEIKYTEFKPSQFTVEIEELGGGKVIARTFPSEHARNICSPFIGDVTDARVKMKCFRDLKHPKAGTDFFLDRYTGKFRIEVYIIDRKDDWWLQETGYCEGVEKKF
jgi:hypothetical protein|tara:strand:+ start:40 stop:471 length:432 start_codon:yes stop_codon:yes gene_type:complete